MTEGDNKKIGIVVDLNISRVLTTCINYTVYKNEKNINDKINYLIKNNLINIDVDMMLNKKIDAESIIKKIMDIWKEDPINSFKSLMKRLDNDYEELDNPTQKLINKYFVESSKNNIVGAKIIFKDDEDEIQKLPTGKQKIKEQTDDDSDDTDDTDDSKEKQISFTKDVLKQIIPLTCILTIKNSNMDFVRMLNDIKDNPELLDTFDDQCLIWWNKKGLIDFIKDIVDKYFDKTSNTYNISIQLKMSLQSLIDNPKELLELISECLTPKNDEKKKFGEVFTPIKLINEMLDKLPMDVWTNKNLKWLDPTSGMGNFPIAVYLRLMENLKDEIKDSKERKKHILENMLYMIELNKKNVLITKQIFDINNEYKLNIYEGDSLQLDYYEEFKIKQFDIIIGNPPYQEVGESGKPIHGKIQLYTKFVIKCMNITKYLLFITPSSILTPSSSVYNLLIKENHMVYLNVNNIVLKKYFQKVGSTFCYYLIKNTNILNKTIIENEYSIFEEDLYNYDFLPKIITKETLSLNNKILKNKETVFERKDNWECKLVSNNKDDIYKYPQYFKHNLIKYSKEPHILQDKHKVILFRSGYLNPIYTTFGFGGNILYKLVNNKDEGINIVNNYNNKIIKFILDMNKFSGFNNQKIINMIFNDNFINNIDIIKTYNITTDEIKFIELYNKDNIIKYKKKDYYLIENKIYDINKDDSIGKLFGNYIDNKIIELNIVTYKTKIYILENNIMYKIKEDSNKNIIKGSKCGVWNEGDVKKYVKKSTNKENIIEA
jgi:hypothetical protein